MCDHWTKAAPWWHGGVWQGDMNSSWSLTVMEQPLVSYLILSTMPLLSYQMNYPLLSYQMNYPTLQLGCYGTALYLIFYILSLFGLVDIIIRFDSCLALLHTADSMLSHYFILLTLKPYPYSAKLYSYTAISLYVLSFTPYLLIFLSSYLWLIWWQDHIPLEDIWTISYWMISLG